MARLKDIAELTGLSIRHVSRVIRGEGHVDAKTAELINEAVKQLNYSPNLTAKSLRNQQSYDIMLFAWHTSETLMKKIGGVSEAARNSMYSIVIELFSDKNVNSYIKSIEKRVPAGVILIPQPYPEKLIRFVEILVQKNIPFVALDSREPGIDSIVIDMKAGVCEAVEYLIKSGRKRIAYAGEDKPWDIGRLEGYRETMRNAGLDEIYIEVDTKGERDIMESGRDAAEKFLAMKKKPEAVQMFSDRLAFGFINELHRHAVKVPDDVAVVGFDDLNAASWYYPPLTTVAQPNFQIGHAAYNLLLDKINRKTFDFSGIKIMKPSYLIKRCSA